MKKRKSKKFGTQYSSDEFYGCIDFQNVDIPNKFNSNEVVKGIFKRCEKKLQCSNEEH